MISHEFDAAKFLDNEEVIAEYISQVLSENNSDLLLLALKDIARAHGMTKLARDTGLTREALYRSLEQGSKPRFDTIQRIITALGIQFSAKALSSHAEPSYAPKVSTA